MKKALHPKYVDSTIICACGNNIHTRSVKPSINLDICSACHPFFSGKLKLVDAEGRVDKFKKKYTVKK
jgi:large subunit ribosomal protein L31